MALYLDMVVDDGFEEVDAEADEGMDVDVAAAGFAQASVEDHLAVGHSVEELVSETVAGVGGSGWFIVVVVTVVVA